MSDRGDVIMLRMGFPRTETGPYVTELRNSIERQVSEGMRSRSGGTWGVGLREADLRGTRPPFARMELGDCARPYPPRRGDGRIPADRIRHEEGPLRV